MLVRASARLGSRALSTHASDVVVVGTGVSRVSMSEAKQIMQLERLSKVTVDPDVKDWVGVFMPPPPDCPEMQMPVRVAQVLKVNKDDRTVDVGHWFPKDSRYDGRHQKWTSNVEGPQRPWYKQLGISFDSLCANFGDVKTTWKVSKAKGAQNNKKLCKNALRIICALPESNYESFCDTNSRDNKRLLMFTHCE